MGIFRAIGFIIFLIALRLIIPEIFNAGEGLALTFIGFMTDTVTVAGDALQQTASVLDAMQ